MPELPQLWNRDMSACLESTCHVDFRRYSRSFCCKDRALSEPGVGEPRSWFGENWAESIAFVGLGSQIYAQDQKFGGGFFWVTRYLLLSGARRRLLLLLLDGFLLIPGSKSSTETFWKKNWVTNLCLKSKSDVSFLVQEKFGLRLRFLLQALWACHDSTDSCWFRAHNLALVIWGHKHMLEIDVRWWKSFGSGEKSSSDSSSLSSSYSSGYLSVCDLTDFC